MASVSLFKISFFLFNSRIKLPSSFNLNANIEQAKNTNTIPNIFSKLF